ncbi:uncharacterized protein N7479_011251 [Penicillium vulpinum]|uniref:Uncharacterized protein n=1 Tax=Penicillium vulpinum TaxID=29845 RepID=A0A1V6RS58_9EURO|nr:uncharacterized protein N7479_011251 [Penicillium vulpinum]KAJ5952838.1 hypothetical protein N7479_011251 [Penicillium vulpinum]OQE04398.1 hypothetical protein PENVUL_c033G07674 [Penicillium vulpinum]
MSLDRIIQDSDEDEPLEGDDLPTSVKPLQPSQPALHQEYQQAPAKQATHNAVQEHGPALDESTFSQLNVNFDEFLQSQERNHSMLSSSQQRLEDKWIPSTSDGGSGSVGAMMTEIGIAQRRLLDDDPSSASLMFPSTTAPYSTESFQSAPFPTIPSYHSYQMAQPTSNSFTYNPASISVYVDANQTLLPTKQSTDDLTSPDTTNPMASPPKIVPHQAIEPSMEQKNPLSNPPQEASQPKSQQTSLCSPHDTEPISSVASMRFSEAKITTAGTSLVSPQQSQSSTHDELALPAIPTTVPEIETPGAKKKRRRPKKQPMPDNDEDDELANSRDHEFNAAGVNGAIEPSDGEEITEDNTPSSSGVPDETDEENLDAAPKPAKSGLKEPKKKKAKKTKTSPTPQPDDNDDDVIWVDTKPHSMEPSVEKATPLPETPQALIQGLDSNVFDSNPPVDPQLSIPAVEETQKVEKPAPKKRGRKRKQTTDQAETPSESADTPEPNKLPSGAQTPASKLAVVVNNSPRSMLEADTGNNDVSAIQSNGQKLNPLPGPDPLPETTIDTPQPQTPLKSDAASVNTPQNTGKGPNKHSPISARSGVPYRVGLSKRARIAPLLKMVRK